MMSSLLAFRLGPTAVGLLALGIVVGSCLPAARFACEDDGQCVLDGVGGFCDAGYCSYPDDTCASGRRYHAHAPEGLADRCVDASGSTTMTTTTTTGVTISSSSGSPESSGESGATPICGDGLVEGDEQCDDGNTLDDAECNRRCESPGELLWSHVPELPGRSRATDVVALADGLIIVGESERGDLDAAVWRYEFDGEPGWSNRIDGPSGGEDWIEAVARRGDELLMVGASQGYGAVFRLDLLGEVQEVVQADDGFGSHWFDVAVAGNGSVFVTGQVELADGDPDIVTRCILPDLSGPCGEATFAGPEAGGGETGHGIAVRGEGMLVVGEFNPGPADKADLFVQTLDLNLNVLMTSTPERGPLTGWTGVAWSDSGLAYTSGYLDQGSGLRQIRLGAFDESGASIDGRVIEREIDGTDFGRAVAVDSLGNVIVVGEIDLTPEPIFREYRPWIGKFGPDLEEIWIRTLDIDEGRARGVGLTADDVIVVVGDREPTMGQTDRFVAAYSP